MTVTSPFVLRRPETSTVSLVSVGSPAQAEAASAGAATRPRAHASAADANLSVDFTVMDEPLHYIRRSVARNETHR